MTALIDKRDILLTVKELARRMYRFPGEVRRAILVLLLHTALAVSSPRIIGFIIDNSIIPKNLKALFIFGSLYALVDLLRLITARFQTVYFAELGQEVMNSLRIDLFQQIVRLPIERIQQLTSGGVTTRLTSDIAALASMFEAAFLRVVDRFVVAIAIFCGIFILSPKLGMIALFFMPLFLIASVFVTKILFRAYHEIRILVDNMTRSFSETLAGMEVIKLYGLEERRFDHFTHQADGLARAEYIPPSLFSLLHPGMTIVIGFGVASLLWWGGPMVLSQEVSAGVLVTLMSYMIWVFWPILAIVNQWNVFMQGITAAHRIFEVFDWEIERHAVPGHDVPAPVLEAAQSLTLTEVSYTYPNSNHGVKNINLHLARGEIVGVVGASGAGKSTVVKILLRLVKLTGGSVKIGPVDIYSTGPQWVRSQVGFVPQDIFLFRGNLRENLTLGSDEASGMLTELEARAPSHVRELLSRSDATSLSRGERQLLSFIRAVIRNPGVIVLDEASASLDQRSEAWVESELFHEVRRRTTLIIAHKLQTLRRVDRLIVMHEGQIVEQGRHDELMQNQDGIYRKFYQLQQMSEQSA